MTSSESAAGLWAPSSCTLPTVEQPLREREFDEFFAAAVTEVVRVDSVTARLVLRPEPELAARAAELCVRETGCCSFFTFRLTFTEGVVVLDVSVPPTQAGVLDALTARAHADAS